MWFKIDDENILEFSNVIYCLTNVLNGKKYVGMTSRNLKQRLKEHIKCTVGCRDDGESKQLITKSIKKNGAENFKVEVLQVLNEGDDINSIEIEWIEKLGTFKNCKYGYNMTAGGMGLLGWKHSNETKKQMSKNRMGNKNPQFGKSHKGWGSGLKRSSETIEKLRINSSGRTHTKDARRRIGNATAKHKRKSVIKCLNDGTELETYLSIKEAARAVCGQNNKITAVLRGTRKTHKGYVWKYALFQDNKPYKNYNYKKG